jgi:hypothetical protein
MSSARAGISADALVTARAAENYRLIVQSYALDGLDGELPSAHARPLSSVQRAITPEQLRNGISVDLVQIANDGQLPQRAGAVIAWVEAGHPDLEFDALMARLPQDAAYGVARLGGDELAPARIVLRGRPA